MHAASQPCVNPDRNRNRLAPQGIRFCNFFSSLFRIQTECREWTRNTVGAADRAGVGCLLTGIFHRYCQS